MDIARQPQDEQDFPAAHSMDTSWYAVDADGHVAQFSTGEAGAAPNSAFEAVDYEDVPSVLDLVRQFPPDSGIEYFVDDLVKMPGGPVFNYSWSTRGFEAASFSDGDSFYSALLLLNDESLLHSFPEAPKISVMARMWRRATTEAPSSLQPCSLQRIPNSKYILAFVEEPLPVATLQRWLKNQLVRRAWVNHDLSAWRFGVFEYSHGDAFENWISGPYLRDGTPPRPLQLTDFPEALRPIFANTKFPKSRFARDAAVDPREVGPCSSWEPSWIGLDGIVHRDPDGGDDDSDEADEA